MAPFMGANQLQASMVPIEIGVVEVVLLIHCEPARSGQPDSIAS